MKRDISAPLRDSILHYMNICIARSLLAVHQGDVEVEVEHASGRIMLNAYLHDMVELQESDPRLSPPSDIILH